MMTDGKHEGTPQQGEGDDALWRLLERAPRPGPVSPYFARRVLREVAALGEACPSAGGASNWLARTWQAWRRTPGVALASATAVAALLVVGGMGLSPMRWHSPVGPAVAIQPEPEAPNTTSVAEPPASAYPVADADASPASSAAAPAEPVVTAQDVEVIADLDNVLSREESRLWTEDDNTARF